MKSLTALVAALSIVVLAILFFFRTPDDRLTDAGPEDRGSTSETRESPISKEVTSGPLRQQVESSEADTDPDSLSHAPLVTPFEVKIRVVDKEGDNVPWATVEVWPALRTRMRAAGSGRSSQTSKDASVGDWAYSGRHPGLDPLLKLSTDATGRCTFKADREFSLLSVHKDGVGRSSDISISPLVNTGERRVVLTAISVITGVVLQSTGSPKSDAKVRAILVGGPSNERLPSQVITRADSHGRFRFEISARATYVVIAGDKSLRSDKVRIPPIPGGGERKIVLQLPGSYSLRGTVLDPKGKPVDAGSVVTWISGLRQSSMRSARVLKGQFQLPLTSGGLYVVRAQGEGYAYSKSQSIQLSDAVQSVHLTLHLLPLGRISGRVLGPDNTPIPGASMKAWRQIPGMQRIEAREPLIATTAKDGTFVFQGSHPAAKYTIVCMPDASQPRLAIRRQDLAGNGSGLEFRVARTLLTGSTVVGRFTDGKSNKPVQAFKIQILQHRNGAISSLPPKAFTSAKGLFKIEGLKVGETYSLKATAKDCLTTLSKTFEALAGEHPLHLVSPIPCRVICRIRRDDGRSIQGIKVRWVPAGSLRMVLPTVSGVTDHTGAAEAQAAPGKYSLFVFPGGSKKRIIRTVQVDSGILNAVDVTL
jgi:hypothetical protein